MAVPNSPDNDVSVFLNTSNTGSISFAGKADFGVGTDPIRIAIGDLDGDGKLDIVTANNGGSNVSVLRNTSAPGSLSFATNADFTALAGPTSIVMGDLDADGLPDLVVTDDDVDMMSVFENTSVPGSISFATKVDFLTGDRPFSAKIGDLDGDAVPDVAVYNLADVSVSLFRNLGSFSFDAKVDYAMTGSSGRDVALGDLDGDGKLDFVSSGGASNVLSVRRNATTSSGAFSAASFEAAVDFGTGGTLAAGVAIGDLDGDGKPELVSTNFTTTNTISVLHNLIPTDPAPTITSGLTTSGKPGDSVTITGTNFDATAANNTVFFDPIKATVTAATTTQLTVTVPDGAGYGPVRVTVNNRTAATNAFFLPTFDGIAKTITSGTMADKVDFTTGTQPFDLAAGDLDGDGKPDLVVPNFASTTVSVFLNASTTGGLNASSFTAQATLATGTSPVNVAIGDLDGDGKPDLAVANFGGTSVSVFHNTSTVTGTITFATKEDFTTASAPRSVAIEDIDGDGKLDLAVTNSGVTSVSVLRNTTIPGTIDANSFSAKEDFTAGSTPSRVAFGDINGDGKPDMAVSNQTSNTVSIFQNTSTSGTIDANTFAGKVDFTTETNPRTLQFVDVDGDGNLDLAVANRTSDTVSIFRNAGNTGTIDSNSLEADVPFPGAGGTIGVAFGDVDGDGKPDMAVGNFDDSTVSVFLNTQTSPGTISLSSFATKVDFDAGTGAGDVVVIVDFDGDGKPDVATADFSSNSLSVFHNIADPPTITSISTTSGKPGDSVIITGTSFDTTPGNNTVFFDPIKATVTSATTTSLSVTVPDGSGYGPISVTVNTRTAVSDEFFLPTFAGIAKSISTGTLADRVTFTTGATAFDAKIGDLDGDGKPDLVVVNNGPDNVSVYHNTSTEGGINSGSFAAKVDYGVGTDPIGVTIADLDGDDKPELIVANNAAVSVSVLKNTSISGSISFAAKVDFTVNGNPTYVAVADFDGDGKPDLAANSQASSLVAVLRNTTVQGAITTASFATKVTFTTDTTPAHVIAGDVDGDGSPDLLTANTAGNSISILRNTATAGTIDSGSFATKVDFAAGTGAKKVALVDGDGDGKLDVVVANNSAGTISVFGNTATSGTIDSNTLGVKTDLAAGTAPTGIAIGDFDGDGLPDVAIADDVGTLSLFENTSSGSTVSLGAKVDFSLGGITARDIDVADLDGDNRPEVVIPNLNSGTVSVFHNIADPPTISTIAPTKAGPGETITLTGTSFSTTAADNHVFFGGTKGTVTAATTTSLSVEIPIGASNAPIALSVNGRSTTSIHPFTPSFRGFSQTIDSDFLAPDIDFVTGDTPIHVVVGDIDGDGYPDIVTSDNGDNQISVFRNLNAGATISTASFAAKVSFSTAIGPAIVALADLDQDGQIDVVTTNASQDNISILRNTSTSGSVAFVTKVDFTTGAGSSPRDVGFSDFDRDGKIDIAVASRSTGKVSVLRNLSTPGTLAFAAREDLASGGSNPRSLAIADFNDDGKVDIAVANETSASVSTFENTTTPGTIDGSSFGAAADFTIAAGPLFIITADLDGDGMPDIASTGTTNLVSVLRNNCAPPPASIAFETNVDFTTSLNAIRLASGDLDGDGRPEIVTSHQNATVDTVSIFHNVSTSGTIDASSFEAKFDLILSATADPSGLTIADLDGDTVPELIVAAQSMDSISVFQNLAKLAIENVTIDAGMADPQGVLVRLADPDSGVTLPIGAPITVSVVAFPAVTVDSVLIGLSSDSQPLNFGNLGHVDTLTTPTASTTKADTFRTVFTVVPGDTQMTAPSGIVIARVLLAGDALGFRQLDNQSTFDIIAGSPELGLVGDGKTFGIDGERPLATAIDSALIDTAALTNTGGTIFGARATTDGADGVNQLIRSFKIGDEVTVKLGIDNSNFQFTQLDSVFLYVVDAITPGYQVPDSAFVSVAFSALEVFLQNGNVTHTFTVVDSLFQTAQIDDNVRVQVLAHFRDKAGNLSAATTDAATAAAFSMDILTVADTRSPIVSPIHPTTAGDAFTGRIDTTLTFRQDNGTTDNALSFELNPLALTVDEGTSAILVAVDTDTASFSGADGGDTLQLATVDSFAAPIGEAAGATIDLTLVGIDSVGNRTPISLDGVILDQVAPNATNVFPTVAALDTNVINSETRHPRFTVDEPLDSVAVRFIEDAAITPTLVVQSLNAAELADFGENVMITVTTSLEDGTTYTLQILTKDQAGNVAVTSVETLTYDASFTNPEADSFIVTLDSSATVIDSVIAGVNLPIKITAIDTALSNADERLRPAVTFTGQNVTVHVDAGDQDTSTVSYAGTGVIDNGDGTTTLSNDDWVIGSRILKMKSKKVLDDFSLVVTSKDSAYSGRLDSLTVDAAELSTYSIVALEDGLIADAVAGDFDLHVAPADAFGNPSTKVFVTTAADLTDADSLVASSNLLASRIPGSNLLGSVWVEFAANVGDVALPDGSHKVVAEGAEFTLVAPNRTGEGLVISVRTTNAPGDTSGVTQPHTIAIGRSVPFAFFAEGDTPAVILQSVPPDTVVVADYRGANNEGDQGGFVVVTFPPSKDGEARDQRVNHYRVYREISVTTGVNDFGELVETGDTTLAFVSWAVIDAPPENTLIVAVVPAIDNVQTRWGVAGEYGAISGEAGPLAKSSISPKDDVNADDIKTMLQGFGISIAQPITVGANGGSPATDNRDVDDAPPSSQPTPVDKNAIATAQFDPQPPRITSAKLSSTLMTLSEPARAIDNIPPTPVTNVVVTSEGADTRITWTKSSDDRPVGSIPYRGFAIPIPGVARYRILVGEGATGLESQGTVSPGTVTYAGVLEGSLIRVDAEDLDNITEGPVVPLGAASFVDADGNPVYIIVFGGNTPLQQDFEDFIEFARSFAASEGDENYNILADIDKDGEIGFADFLTFVQAFNRIAVDPAVAGPATKTATLLGFASESE